MIKDPVERRKYQAQWSLDRKYLIMSQQKCETCGSSEQLIVSYLENGAKRPKAVWWTADVKEILAFLKKTHIFCRTHYWDYRKELSRKNMKHGGYVSWKTFGCKCDKCKAYAKAKNQAWSDTRRKRREAARAALYVKLEKLLGEERFAALKK